MKIAISMIVSILLCGVSLIQAQNPHIIFKEHKLSTEQQKLRNAIPEWTPQSRNIEELPSSIDNSLWKFFPAVFNQGANNSCSQASGVRYAYTYEACRILDRDAKASAENTFAYHYTWNYLNEGKNEGSHPYLGYELMKTCGAMSLADMNDESAATSATTWATGYDKYLKAMKYSVAGYEKFSLKNRSGIDRLRQYLYNHGTTGQKGGIVTFSYYTQNWGEKTYSGVSNTGIKYIITKAGYDGPHALTIVGYDDSVEYDFNGNGVIDDIEKGAFIFVNSWGTYWGDNGKCYIPYSIFLTPVAEGGMRDLDAEACMVIPKIEEPKLVFKIKITYNRRNELYFKLGVNDGMDKNIPDASTTTISSIMNLQGGAYPMRGDASATEFKTIEVALNYSEYYNHFKKYTDPKFFLTIRRTAASGVGEIVNFSVVDLVSGKEYLGEQTGVSLTRGETILNTGTKNIEDGVSCSPAKWLQAGSFTPYPSPFILKTAKGKTVKFQVKGYDRKNGKITIHYKKY